MLTCPVEQHLEEAGQLAVPVGDVSCAVFDQGRDDLAQGREGQIDGGSFLEPPALSPRLHRSENESAGCERILSVVQAIIPMSQRPLRRAWALRPSSTLRLGSSYC